MAGDLSSTVPVNSTSRFHYRIDGPDRSAASLGDRSAAVRDALGQCHDLLSERGEAPENGVAKNVLAIYASFDEAARAAFFDGLIDRFSVDPAALQRAAEAYVRNPSDDTLQALQQASEAPLRDLFLRLNGAPGRRRGSSACASTCLTANHQAWAGIESDLTHVLRLLFNRSVLDFQQIDLETPSPVLERLIEAEAVHPVNDWREMGRRLEADRRCYAFFHPAWPQRTAHLHRSGPDARHRVDDSADPRSRFARSWIRGPAIPPCSIRSAIASQGSVDSRSATPCSAVPSSNCGPRCPGCGGSRRFRRFPDFDRGSPLPIRSSTASARGCRENDRGVPDECRTSSSPCALTICSA